MKRIELIAACIAAVLLAVAISMVGNWYMLAQKAKSRGDVLNNASAGVVAGVLSDKAGQAIDNGVAAGRAEFHDTKEKAKRNEPTTLQRANASVPVSVRNAYSARRRARERLGCAGSECAKGR